MIHFEDFIMQDEADKYNMLQECNAYIKSKDKEIERLNNIINELEKYINNEWNAIEKELDNSFFDGYDTCIEEMKKDILDKIKELKGSNNNE